MFAQRRLYLLALSAWIVFTSLLVLFISSSIAQLQRDQERHRPKHHALFDEHASTRTGASKWSASHWVSKISDALPDVHSIPGLSSFGSSGARSAELPWARPPSQNPYRLPGVFHSDGKQLRENRWVPLDPSADAPPSLIRALQRGPEKAGEEHSWFKDRTVLLLSDSMGREHLQAFCAWFGSARPDIFGPDHPHYPAWAVEMENKHSPGREYNFAKYGRPFMCHHQAWNFTMFYYFLGTFDDTAEQVEPGWSIGGFWDKRTAHWTPPVNPLDRVRSVIKPIMDHYGREPDLIEIGLTAWTLSEQKTISHDDRVSELIKTGMNQTEIQEEGHLAAKTTLSLDFVRHWREQLADFVDQLRWTYGNKAPILYRLMQLTDQHEYYPHLYVDHRTATLNRVAATVPTLEMDHWGEMILGHEYFGDWIHPGMAPKYLWMEMMLFRLWEAVTDAVDGRRYRMPVPVPDEG